MYKVIMWGVLIVSVLWWMFPDFFPGPIDDLISMAGTVISAAALIAGKSKEGKTAAGELPGETPPQIV